MKNKRFERENYLGLYLWLALIVISLSLYFLNPERFNPDNIRRFFDTNLHTGLFIYFVLACLRGFTLIPLTPLLIAGILVFPPWALFLVNLGGIVVSSAVIYYLSRALGFDSFFSTHYPAQIARLGSLLSNREFPVILVWSFAPVFPTDLIVYVCSVLGIGVVKTLAGVTIGEAVICAAYIFGGEAGLDFLLPE